MLMMLIRVRITLKAEFNTALESNQKSRTSSTLLLQMLMKQTKERITWKVVSNTVLE